MLEKFVNQVNMMYRQDVLFYDYFWYIVLVIGLIAIISTLAIKLGRKKSNSNLDILKKRYAKGEITKEEYDKMKDDFN